MSLDGFVAGPRPERGQPARDRRGAAARVGSSPSRPRAGGTASKGARSTKAPRSSRKSLANIGATVMGRNMFGGHPGPWDVEETVERLVGSQPAVPSPRVRAHASRTRSHSSSKAERRSRSSRKASRRRSSRRAGPPAGRMYRSPAERVSPSSISRPASWTRWRSTSCRRSSAAASGSSMGSATTCAASRSCVPSPPPGSRTSSSQSRRHEGSAQGQSRAGRGGDARRGPRHRGATGRGGRHGVLHGPHDSHSSARR